MLGEKTSLAYGTDVLTEVKDDSYGILNLSE